MFLTAIDVPEKKKSNQLGKRVPITLTEPNSSRRQNSSLGRVLPRFKIFLWPVLKIHGVWAPEADDNGNDDASQTQHIKSLRIMRLLHPAESQNGNELLFSSMPSHPSEGWDCPMALLSNIVMAWKLCLDQADFSYPWIKSLMFHLLCGWFLQQQQKNVCEYSKEIKYWTQKQGSEQSDLRAKVNSSHLYLCFASCCDGSPEGS